MNKKMILKVKDWKFEKDRPIIYPKTKARKIKASWTPELAQDLQFYHSIDDVEVELTALILSAQKDKNS